MTVIVGDESSRRRRDEVIQPPTSHGMKEEEQESKEFLPCLHVLSPSVFQPIPSINITDTLNKQTNKQVG